MKVDPPVTSVADARANLSGILRTFRTDAHASPVVVGAHRRAEAVIVPIRRFERMTSDESTPETASVMSFLRARRDLIGRLADLSNIRSVAVFGSVAREAETEDSDVDLLVEPSEHAGLFDLAQFARDMEQLTGRTVDVVSRRSLDPIDDAVILDDAVAL